MPFTLRRSSGLWNGSAFRCSTIARAFVSQLRARHLLARTWIVFAHRFAERDAFLRPARQLVPQLDAFEGDGAGAYLFDFGTLAAGDGGSP